MKTCVTCNAEIEGRKDKIYCNNICGNRYRLKIRRAIKEVTGYSLYSRENKRLEEKYFEKYTAMRQGRLQEHIDKKCLLKDDYFMNSLRKKIMGEDQ